MTVAKYIYAYNISRLIFMKPILEILKICLLINQVYLLTSTKNRTTKCAYLNSLLKYTLLFRTDLNGISHVMTHSKPTIKQGLHSLSLSFRLPEYFLYWVTQHALAALRRVFILSLEKEVVQLF